MKRRLFALCFLIAALAVIVAGCGGSSSSSSSGGEATEAPSSEEGSGAESTGKGGGMKVGFVYVSPLPGSAWSEAWDATRKGLEKKFGAETTVVQPIEENTEVVGVLQGLIREGNELIFATALGYQPYVEQVAEENPEVDFVVTGPWLQETELPPNVSAVYANLWEVRYLSGMVAGAMTKSNTLGFVSAFSVSSVVAGINGFELGAKATNPEAKTKVVFTSAWYNPPQNTQAAETLAKSGADVIAKHQDDTGAIIGAEQSGAWAIGSEYDTSSQNPKAFLTGSVYDWEPYAIEKYEQAEKGTFKNDEVNGDLKSGMVELAPLNSAVPASVKKEVEKAEAEMKAGKRFVFEGPLKSNTGEEVLKAGEAWKTPAEVYEHSEFLVEGIEGKIQE
ncbi:MAG TPA: BMP family ABC transporter substrate-binding protein [Solirubrobacterales bacterium]|nr:BMP family ABC transporter substrate-binding protein [Solirubrobacterales bacterium]